jgi:hypothetical protein
MKKVIRLTESDLIRIIKRVIKEEENSLPGIDKILECAKKFNVDIFNPPKGCKPTLLSPIPDPQTCINAIVATLGGKAQDFANCVGVKLPSTTPVMNERRYRRR